MSLRGVPLGNELIANRERDGLVGSQVVDVVGRAVRDRVSDWQGNVQQYSGCSPGQSRNEVVDDRRRNRAGVCAEKGGQLYPRPSRLHKQRTILKSPLRIRESCLPHLGVAGEDLHSVPVSERPRRPKEDRLTSLSGLLPAGRNPVDVKRSQRPLRGYGYASSTSPVAERCSQRINTRDAGSALVPTCRTAEGAPCAHADGGVQQATLRWRSLGAARRGGQFSETCGGETEPEHTHSSRRSRRAILFTGGRDWGCHVDATAVVVREQERACQPRFGVRFPRGQVGEGTGIWAYLTRSEARCRAEAKSDEREKRESAGAQAAAGRPHFETRVRVRSSRAHFGQSSYAHLCCIGAAFKTHPISRAFCVDALAGGDFRRGMLEQRRELIGASCRVN